MDKIDFDLPYPPSINHYYIRTARGVILGASGKAFRRDVCFILSQHKGLFADERLSLTINVYPPDKRRRDIDNICKATLDALEHAGLYDNDNQIDKLIINRLHVVSYGLLSVSISVIN